MQNMGTARLQRQRRHKAGAAKPEQCNIFA